MRFRFWRREAWGFKSLHPHHFENKKKILFSRYFILFFEKVFHFVFHFHVLFLFCSRRNWACFDVRFWLALLRYFCTIPKDLCPVTDWISVSLQPASASSTAAVYLQPWMTRCLALIASRTFITASCTCRLPTCWCKFFAKMWSPFRWSVERYWRNFAALDAGCQNTY